MAGGRGETSWSQLWEKRKKNDLRKKRLGENMPELLTAVSLWIGEIILCFLVLLHFYEFSQFSKMNRYYFDTQKS